MRAGLAAVLLLLGGACGREHPAVSYDLAALLPTAEVLTETTDIDFGTAQADGYMLEGWAPNAETAKESFTWGIRDRSIVRWFAVERRAVTIRFRCQPRPAEFGHGPGTIAVDSNGQAVETVTLRPEMAEYAVGLRAAVVRPGWNRLTFTYGSTDGAWENTVRTQIRPLAVAWDWLRVEGTRTSAARPSTGFAGGAPVLDLPADVRVDYYLAAAPGSELTLDALAVPRDAVDEDGVRLAVEIEPSGTPAQTVVLAPSTRSQSVSVPIARDTHVRMSLRVLPGGSAGGEPALELVRPRLTTPSGSGSSGDGDRAPPCPGAGAHATANGRAPNVILYVIDTLRADHVGVYGYPQPTSPNIDDFAAGSTVFTNALANASWTRPSMASVFTGRRPQHHGVNGRTDALPDTAVTLAELLQRAGYATAGYIANSNVIRELGFGQGFDTYDFTAENEECELDPCAREGAPSYLLNPRASRERCCQCDEEESSETSYLLNAHALRWLTEQRPAGHPFFLYLHAVDPHAPYQPPSTTRDRLAPGVDRTIGYDQMLTNLVFLAHAASDHEYAGILQLYDGEIAFSDQAFGAFLHQLKDLGLYDDALIILLADHGEEFLDHGGWLHGRTLYDEQLRVPLIIKRPSQRATEHVDAPAQLIDVLPTVLAAAGLGTPPDLDGHDLFAACPDPREPTAEPLFASLDFEGNAIDSVQLATWKLVRRTAQAGLWWYPPIELFDLAVDPHEQHNLAETREVDVGYLTTLLDAEQLTPRARPAAPAPLPAGAREQLRALGYGT